ncbi:MAG: hypothetical protein HY657_04845 [Acidobacteria bacterium]|nr:hypothetical protein [Acidobacteriota bacterium]
MTQPRHVTICGLALCIALVAPTTLVAQVDLAGEWANRVHEDQLERAPGPEIGDYLGLPINDEPVDVLHQPGALTDGDVIVHFRRSDVIATGDIFRLDGYPVVDATRGGSIQGVLAALNAVIDITVPKNLQEGGTMVIPGHGRICDESDVVHYRDMLTIIQDRVADLVKEGKTLEQVRAVRPSRDYDARYGATTGTWTTDMFIEVVYRGLMAGPRPRSSRFLPFRGLDS